MVRYGHRVRQAKGLGGRTVWSEDLNTRMVESKSARILNDFNGFSDETADSAPRYINRLETQSEYMTPSRRHSLMVAIRSGEFVPKQNGTIILVHNNPSSHPSSRSITDHHSYAVIERDYVAVGSA